MAVNWNADGMLVWKEEAVKEQQGYFDLLGTPMWREFEQPRYDILKREIGFALFGCPEEEPCALNEFTGYTDKKLKEINKIFDIIQKCLKHHTNPKNICVSFLHVLGKTKHGHITAPVMRILYSDSISTENINLFIDSSGRVYKGWQDYLENNKLLECVLCYPRNGVYSAVNGDVEVEFGISPAGWLGAKFHQGLEIGRKVLSVGSAAGALTAAIFVPGALPVAIGAAGLSALTVAYALRRKIHTPVDHDQDQQSIGLDNAESQDCWLGKCIVSRGTTVATAKTVREGATLSLEGQIAVKSVAVGSCVFSGLAVCNELANINVKARNKEVTALDVFQFTSAVLYFTHSVISAHQAMSLINSMGKNNSGESSGGIKALMNQIYECLGTTNGCNIVPGVTVGCSYTKLTTGLEGRLLWSVCSMVGKKLTEITKSMLRDPTSACKFVLNVRELLLQFGESWNKEMDDVFEVICRAFGVKHWLELVIKGCRGIESGHIRAMASTLIAEKRSLVECGSTAMSSHQKQAISDSSAVVGTDDGPNGVVDGQTQTYESYYDEITNIHAKCVEQQMCRNPADFCKYATLICKFVKIKLQERKSNYEKSLEKVKHFKPDVNIEDFNKQYGICGNPNDHFLQEVFNEFRKEEQDVFTLLQLAYESQNASTSAQEEENRQGFLDVDGVRFYPFYNMRGLASNGMLSRQQYREMAAKLTGQRADTYTIYMSASGDTAVLHENAAPDVIMVQCWPEDGKVSGIAAVLHTAAE